jgi:thiol:disulfide interchange protein DsbA
MKTPLLKLIPWLLVLLGLPLSIPAAENAEFQEGTHYRRLATPVSTSTEDKIEVVELFWYGCPHCYSLEPAIDRWLEEDKPENAEFVRIPAVLNRNWELGARAFYTARELDVLDKIHSPLMNAIHAQGRPMRNEADLAEFFAEQGVDKEAFRKAYNSFAVETTLRRAQQLVRSYGVHSVPSFVIDGKYVVNASMAGSEERLFEIINYLIQKET